MTPHVFDSSTIAGVVLKNRIIRSATHESLADSFGAPTEALVKLYTSLAKGGAGAIITGYAGVQQDGRSSLPGMLMIDDDNLVAPYRRLTDAVHRFGTPIYLQLAHCGRQTRSAITGVRTVAPSALKDKIFNEEVPHELDEREIEIIISNFAAAAGRAAKAGFDGVQLHLAHGYLLSSFLSGRSNQRRDRWGGSVVNRFRIIAEIISRIKLERGDFPVLAKLNAYDKMPRGMRLNDAVEVARMLEAAGCSAIELSSGVIEDGLSVMRGTELPMEALFACHFRFRVIPGPLRKVTAPIVRLAMPCPKPLLNYNLEAARSIKAAVSIPVIAVGGIHTMEDISMAFSSGAADYVSMSRPFIKEPDIVNKFQERRQTASRCIMCNYCVIMVEGGPLRCWHGKLPDAERLAQLLPQCACG